MCLTNTLAAAAVGKRFPDHHGDRPQRAYSHTPGEAEGLPPEDPTPLRTPGHQWVADPYLPLGEGVLLQKGLRGAEKGNCYN